MNQGNFYKEYQKNEIATSNQGKLILMMYDGAIKFTKMAIQSMEKKDIAAKGKYIQKAHDVVNELSLALDLNKGEDIAKKLEELYQFVLLQLTQANIKSETKPLETILKVLVPLRDAWDDVFKKESKSNGSDPVGPPSKNITSRV